MISIDTIVDGATLTLCLVGEFTNDLAYLPWEAATDAFDDDPATITLVVVDLFAASFPDNAGLTGLVRVRELGDDHGAAVRLRGVDPRTRALLQMTGLSDTFDRIS